jgi:hypothetical protein
MQIFYSWQSDIPASGKVIEKALKLAQSTTHFDLESDTRDNPGAPDIASTILNKISNSDMFLADVTIINMSEKGRKTPNPNVLFELGFALSALTEDNVIMIADKDIAEDSVYPFDIRNRRVKFVSFKALDAKEVIAKIVASAIQKYVPANKTTAPVVFFSDEQVRWANWGTNQGTFTGFIAHLALDNYKGESDYIIDVTLHAIDTVGNKWSTTKFKIRDAAPNKPFPVPPDTMMELAVILSDDFGTRKLMPDIDTDSAKIVITFRSQKIISLEVKPAFIGNNT